MPLISAKLVGPITPLSTSVRVKSILPSAVASILVNGSIIDRTHTASSNVVDIPLAGFSLKPRDVVTVVWSLDGEMSQPSLPEHVLDYPKDLPAPIFTSSIHTAIDWVAIDKLYPGSTVEVFTSNNTLIGGPETAEFGEHRVTLFDFVPDDDLLTVVQTITLPGGERVSSKGQSRPAEFRLDAGQIPEQPVILKPIHECAGAVLIGGAVPGCFVQLSTGEGIFDYPAIAETFWAILPKVAHAANVYTATTVLRLFKAQSIPSIPVVVDALQELEKPLLAPDSQNCPQTVSVTASQLSPGTELVFELRGAWGTTTLGRAGAPEKSTSDVYYLGDLSALVPENPPNPHIILRETACALSVESNAAYVSRSSDFRSVPPAFFTPPVACSWWLNVLNVARSIITVHSDASDWPVLAYWKQTDDNGWILLNRSLRAGEHVWVTIEWGCAHDHLRESEPIKVENHGNLHDIRLEEPIHPGHNRKVSIIGAIPGARVHVFVNGKHRTSTWATGDVTSTILEVYVGDLQYENSVSVCQEMCGRTGELSQSVAVLTGEMIVEISPKVVERGQSVLVTITAKDADTGNILAYSGGRSPIYGPAGFVGYTGQPFTVTAAAGAASPLRFTVTQEGYESRTVDLHIQEPEPRKSATLTIKSKCAIGVEKQVIEELEWTLIGGDQKFSESRKPGTTDTVIVLTLPIPTGSGRINYSLSGNATIEFIQPLTGENLKRPVSVFRTVYGFLGSIDIPNWKGKPLSMEVNIGWTSIINPDTGAQIGEVFYFALNQGPN